MQKLWQQLAIATNWPVLLAVTVLSSLGVVSIRAHARMAVQPAERLDGQKQLEYLVVAILCMIAFQAVNYLIISRWAWPFYLFSLSLVAYTVAASLHLPLPFVHQTKGVYAWLNFGPVSLEPSELVKISFILVLADYLRYRSNYRTLGGLLPPFALALVPVVLILKQPDLGIAALFLPTLLVMLFVAGAKVRHMLMVLCLGVAFVPIFWFAGPRYDNDGPDRQRRPKLEVPVLKYLPQLMKEYQRDRVKAVLSPGTPGDAAKNYQQQQAMTAFGSGGLVGKGLGDIPVGQHVPESQNDMIFALIGEQFGFFGSVTVLGMYLVLFAGGLEIASATKEPTGRLIAVGTVAMLASQATINLMVCLRMLPVTGVTLPFVSYGGSSLLASYMAAGLLLNVGQNRPIVMGNDSFEFD
jgi:rod shape determining protein RodA